MLVTKKLYYSGVMGTEELGKPLQLTMGFLEELSKHTLQKNEIIDLMRDLKYQTASSRLVRFYRMKKCEMTRSILYHY